MSIFHITGSSEWAHAQAAGAYEGDTLSAEGFIHCSTEVQVAFVANAIYRGRGDLVVLHVDEARLLAPVKYENVEGGVELFPHIYGPLNLDAVITVTKFTPGPDGEFSFAV